MSSNFKVWDKSNNQWVVGDFFLSSDGRLFKLCVEESENGTNVVKRDVTAQYTLSWILEQTDTQGNELYQGCVCEVDIDGQKQSGLFLVSCEAQVYHGLHRDEDSHRITKLVKIGDLFTTPDLLGDVLAFA